MATNSSVDKLTLLQEDAFHLSFSEAPSVLVLSHLIDLRAKRGETWPHPAITNDFCGTVDNIEHIRLLLALMFCPRWLAFLLI